MSEYRMNSLMQPSIPAKSDTKEKEVWWGCDTGKRHSAGSNIWRLMPDDCAVCASVVPQPQETLCSLPQCEQMGCNSGWTTQAGTSNYCYCADGHCSGCWRTPTTPGMIHKKVSRSSSDMKRFRVQAGYELSQDLLEKQVEMLEKKYGGQKARIAALIIQRAFRRYKLKNKFASITAMVKAEKRRSRRFQVDVGPGNGNGGSPNGRSPSHHQYQQQHSQSSLQSQFHQQQIESQVTCEQCGVGFDPEVVIRNNFAVLYRELRENSDQRPPRPIRSMSMRERRGENGDSVSVGQLKTGESKSHPPPLPRSQSAGVHHKQAPTAPSDADLVDRDMPSYSQFEEYYMYYTATSLTPCSHHSEHSGTSAHYYSTKDMLLDEDNSFPQMALSHESALQKSPLPNIHASLQYQKRDFSITSQYKTPPNSVTNAVNLSTSSDWGPQGNKKVPPEVPKRTTSVLSRSRSTASPGTPAVVSNSNRAFVNGSQSVNTGSLDNASLSSSDSSISLSVDKSEGADFARESQMWKRNVQAVSPEHNRSSQGPKNEFDCNKEGMSSSQSSQPPLRVESQPLIYKGSETVRKRQYRVGLNLFNKKPERGISHLIRKGFLENSPQGVARFLITRKGLSKQMIGEYLGTLQNPFNMAVLECFAQELDLSGMHIDVALRKFQTYFRMPGEAQKIERLMEIFGQHYCLCNPALVSQFSSPDTVFVLAFAIIMLNTDLHTPNLKPERRMKLEDFVKNLRGIDDGNDIDRELLVGIYERVKNAEFKPGSDHVTQVMKVQSTIGGKKPNLAQSHRRLVCYCRLYEIPDICKKERPGVHQREVFLFNDLLVITKIFSKKKSSVTYTFRQSFSLCGMMVSTFETQYYSYGIRLSQRIDGKVLVMFNARNEHDRCKFAEDLRESICEMDEMESIRIETELERQKSGRRRAIAENRDSGVADVEVALSPTATNTPNNVSMMPAKEICAEGSAKCMPTEHSDGTCDRVCDRERPSNEGQKRSALSNSLLDIHEQFAGEKPQRRGSVGSLDSGMSVSFQSTSASTVSRDSSPQNIQSSPGVSTSGASSSHISNKQSQSSKMLNHQQSFLGSLFTKRDRKASRTDEVNPFCRSTEV